MAARLSLRPSELAGVSRPPLAALSRRRRAGQAFLIGAALFLAAAAATFSRGASAHDPGIPLLDALASQFETSFGETREPRFIEVPLGPAPIHHVKPKRKLSRGPASYGGTRSVCVRLCDGYFFPIGTPAAADGEASCAGLCPDAPTALYSMSAGSDRIEDAVSSRGERYETLPVALRYRSTLDKTCACHRAVANDLSPLLDPTLRKGDAIMTARGVVVFRGAERATHRPRDFASLSAASLPKTRRDALQALERADATPPRGVPRSWNVSVGPSWTARPTGSLLAVAAPRPIAEGAGANAIHFVEPPVSSTD
jgi:hypothetical protein